MYRKLTRKHFLNTINHTKRFISKGYNHTKTFLHHMDNGVNFAKNVFSILEPVVAELSGMDTSGVAKKLVKGVSMYDEVKARAVDGHSKLSEAAMRINSL